VGSTNRQELLHDLYEKGNDYQNTEGIRQVKVKSEARHKVDWII